VVVVYSVVTGPYRVLVVYSVLYTVVIVPSPLSVSVDEAVPVDEVVVPVEVEVAPVDDDVSPVDEVVVPVELDVSPVEVVVVPVDVLV
jgi:hypothetical protein